MFHGTIRTIMAKVNLVGRTILAIGKTVQDRGNLRVTKEKAVPDRRER